ncbi:23S rRNA (guanosine(2251)-2'-O)-methyltransferase RlmB [Thermochromatium tepidum]|jgi:rRNA methylase, putative, group 3|uniref:23S rRNA (guanosine-2'-O-)-methyltransferase RlmB n=1 Tax=Thermochromatium tepidum ATCC 43061 TaxID=316276 RepID=A0A6I6E170_THETI|nr:23S rRNA (guanosine(2251)-2'-O)-methyltransferase RlmB [Thermochromatium tepidum]QGU32675.1 23S rRNA (guanosine(2251)-2'-O)-methyltransferase RlmB [Thermochromatium tepidum ATCC 43061]
MTERAPVGGIHSVRAALKFGIEGVEEVWLERTRRDRRLNELAELVRATGIRVRQVERAELERAAAGIKHQGVLAWVRVPTARSESDLMALLDRLEVPPFLLLLDEIQDPHNLGACLRTAEAAGVQAVIAPKDNAVGLTPVVCKVASGAAATLPYVQVTNLARVMERLKERGIWLIGTAGEASDELYRADLTGPLGLVMGAEGRGLRRLTRERCDRLVRLPMCGQVESLNVSVAAGVCLYEALRQRRSLPFSDPHHFS